MQVFWQNCANLLLRGWEWRQTTRRVTARGVARRLFSLRLRTVLKKTLGDGPFALFAPPWVKEWFAGFWTVPGGVGNRLVRCRPVFHFSLAVTFVVGGSLGSFVCCLVSCVCGSLYWVARRRVIQTHARNPWDVPSPRACAVCEGGWWCSCLVENIFALGWRNWLDFIG